MGVSDLQKALVDKIECALQLFVKNISTQKMKSIVMKFGRVSSARYNMFSSNTSNLPGLSLDQLERIQINDNTLRTRHLKIEGNMSATEKDIAMRKRMIYRSKQRGWLEADILMGSWATENVPTLSDVDLTDYETILKEETIDVFNYITGKDVLPEHLKNLPVMKRLQEYAYTSKLYAPKDYEAIKIKSNLT